jgi:hypothetical protein
LRRNRKTPPVVPPPSFDGRGIHGGRSRSTNDPAAILRRVERKKRLLDRSGRFDCGHLPDDYCARFTFASFRLEGIDLSEQEVWDALGRELQRPVIRSRLGQRLRSHAAILRHIEIDLRKGISLDTARVIRWYTAVSAGLSTTSLDQTSSSRLEDLVRRINAPPPRVQTALREVVSSHARLLDDPLVPGFNGILARLLLRFHLGRWGFPAVLFDSFLDGQRLTPESRSRRLLHLVEQRYDALLSRD